MQSTLQNCGHLHVAVIMDGNGRWAARHNLPRSTGHRAGLVAARRIVEVAPDLGIATLTLFAFSADNWHRPEREVAWLTSKVADLRIFPDEQGRFDRSVTDISGSVLVVSQFTLYADTRRGRRPSFTEAAPPEVAAPLVERVMDVLRERGLRVEGGRFGAHMLVEAVNDGPVTIELDSADLDRPRRD